jgi:peptide/nickel transport system substrate-binding protein
VFSGQSYAEIQRISQEYLPVIYLVNNLEMMSVCDRFEGIKFSALPFDRFWNIYLIWAGIPPLNLRYSGG